MASDRHKEYLKQYKKEHRSKSQTHDSNQNGSERKSFSNGARPKHSPNTNSNASSSTGSGRKTSSSTSRTSRNMSSHSAEKIRTKPPASNRSFLLRQHAGQKYKATLDGLPNEVLLKILSYLTPADLLKCASVSRRWLLLCNDNVIWHKLYLEYVPPKRDKSAMKAPERPLPSYWKSKCIQHCASRRASRLKITKKKYDPFTGLQKDIPKHLQTLGVRWVLGLVNSKGEEHISWHSDVFYFRMAVCARWYSYTTLPYDRIRKLRVYAALPVFYDKKGRAVHNSPCQRSLLYEISKVRESCKTIGESTDRNLEMNLLPHGIVMATWKEGGEIAFVTACIHSFDLIDRCLKGSSDCAYVTPIQQPMKDDVDTQCGLHGYTCTVELRNQRNSFWCQQFSNQHCKPENIVGGFIVLVPIRPDSRYDHSSLTRTLTLPWKTDAFKGIVQNVCILDVTVLDEHHNPIWCISSPVAVVKPTEAPVSYDYEGELYQIDYTDSQGKIHMELIWESRDEKYFIVNMEVYLSTSFVNRWFGTKY